ncbi:MAG: lamin tail domain-containing protein [Saprospiraceae bacterium]
MRILDMTITRGIFCLLAFTVPSLGFSQIEDNFSDGDLTNNPTWQGNTGNFQVNAQMELQLNAPTAGTSLLYVPTQIADSSIWELYFRMEFDPSTSNYLKIYLQSDSPDLPAANGYYLLVGESGSEDALKFYRQDAGSSTLLAAGTLAGVASNPEVRIKLTREVGGLWTMAADYTGGFNYAQEFQVTDAAYGSGSYFFGVQCVYTDSRKDAYYFDDVRVAELLPDTTPPSLVAANPVSATEVDVVFSEPLEVISATEPANFLLDNGIGEPAVAALDAVDKTLVHLTLANPLVSLSNYTLTTSGLADLNGNLSPTESTTFSYIEIAQAVQYDILINEIMADPDPVVALPGKEFIELYNRSNKVIDLAGFGFSNGGTPQVFPSYQMLPGSYVLVCDDSNVGLFAPYGEVIGLPTFPALVNTGDDLSLTGPAGDPIHFVSYTLASYMDNGKADGGWTLELVNPLSPCIGEANWRASTDSRGGTPGQPNAVLNAQADETGPELTQVIASVNNPTQVQLFFNETLDKPASENPAHYLINNGVVILGASLLPPGNHTVLLQLSAPLETRTSYEATVLDNVTDCSGNPIGSSNSLPFVLPEPAGPYDIAINEIMADPNPVVALPDVEFIELYNRSDKVIDLKGLGLSNGGSPQIFPSHLLQPGGFVLVCSSALVDSLASFGDVIGLPSFPALTNTNGELNLTSPSGATIDFVIYSLASYKDSGKQDGGWSLELINPLSPCAGDGNWRASQNLLGGTPGQPNSVLMAVDEMDGPVLTRVSTSIDKPSQVRLYFDEKLEASSAAVAANYSISNGLSVVTATLLPPSNTEVDLQFDKEMAPGTIYEVIVGTMVADCIGNESVTTSKLPFALPETIAPNDIIINEILFNPETGGADFLEIYNRSDKIFNLSDLSIGNLQAGIDTTTTTIDKDRLLFPNSYAVFTENRGDILSRYLVKDENALIENDLPAFNNDLGNVTLFRADTVLAVIIDAFDYDENFHNPLLSNVDGVSLERLNPNTQTQDKNNWHSAAASAGFATPTYLNSQFLPGQPVADDFFEISEPTFSPDGDGYKDFLSINYNMDKPGYSAKVKIFDAEGRLVKMLANNELLAASGFLRWDGDTDDGAKARIGIYVLWIELFHPDGDRRDFKKVCVVAGKL